MNSENSKSSKRHVLILNLTDKIDLSRVEKSIALLNLSINYTWKNHITIINLKYLLQHRMMYLSYQIDHI